MIQRGNIQRRHFPSSLLPGEKAFIMSLWQSTKYILVKNIGLDWSMRGEVFGRGEICEELNQLDFSVPSGHVALLHRHGGCGRGRRFLCPAEGAAKLSESDARNLMEISSSEERYRVFKREQLYRPFPRVLRAVALPFTPAFSWNADRLHELEMNLPVGIIQESDNCFFRTREPSKRNHDLPIEQMIEAIEPFDLEPSEIPPKIKRLAEHRFKLSEQRVQELETALDEERRAHEQTKERLKDRSEKLNELEANLASTQKAREEKEKEVIIIKKVSFETKLTEEQSREVEKQENKTAELDETKRKLASEQKAKEEAEKQFQSCEEKRKELETTLAEVQNLMKRKKEADNECEWILKREEIRLTDEELGRGAFGTVYKGMFRGTEVAVKQVTVKPRITEYNEENFKREMKMAARCRHPCMLQFIGATSDDQSPLLVTELLDTSLKAVLRNRALDPMEIKTIALDVAKGLNYLHLNKPHPIVHRDISSGNVLLWKHGQSWRGKISDYGNAVLMNYARTGSGGALPYLAPEMSNQKFSTKSDVFSFGVLLLEMCLRKEPWYMRCDERDELICLVKDGEMRSLIRSCLQHDDPKQRPSMEEVLAALEQISEFWQAETSN